MAKLKPRARIIRTIGDQLISGPEAALIELVKNAYDADSPWVKIKIEPCLEEGVGGLVSVVDNGHGMTAKDVLTRWFEPATDEKKKRRYSESGKRRMLGAKGIGRFASSRIGKNTKLISVAVSDSNDSEFEKTIIDISWSLFESDKYLDELDIPINVEKYSAHDELDVLTGVSLQITNIKIVWTEKKLKNIIRELRRVASPTDSSDVFRIYLDLSEFKKEDVGFDGRSLLYEENINPLADDIDDETDSTLILPYKIQDYADYKIEGAFNSKGEFQGKFTICRGDKAPQELNIAAPALDAEEELCGPLDVKINIYDRESSAIEELFSRMGLNFKKIGVRKARSILSDNAGIGIYRTGFRIRPYGEPDNDWLRLEGRRVQDPSKKIGHIQVSGQIHIEDEENSGLIERSSREGLEHNGSFERLKNLILGLLVRVEEKRFDFRDKAGLSRKPVGDVDKIKSMASLQKLVTAVTKLPEEMQKPLLKKIEKESQALTKSLEELEAYQKLLESRSAVGLVVAQVIHDGRRLLEPMGDAAKALIDNKKFVLEDSKKGEIVRKYYPIHAETISNGVKGLGKLFKALDPVSGRKRGRPVSFEVKGTLSSSLNLLGDYLIDAGVEVDMDVDDVVAYGYESDMQSALLNIIDNAIYWASSIDSEKKKITIGAKKINNKIKIEISNSGPLVDETFLPRLFNAGFTLKSEGHGLGLVIAREACRASKGDVYYDDNAMDTTFVIEFPAAD